MFRANPNGVFVAVPRYWLSFWASALTKRSRSLRNSR